MSRLEAGTRRPTREMVLTLARPLTNVPEVIDSLMLAAGFLPNHLEYLEPTIPLLTRLQRVILNERVPKSTRESILETVRIYVEWSEREEQKESEGHVPHPSLPIDHPEE